MNTLKQTALSLAVLSSLGVAGCGSPDWQNQYTEQQPRTYVVTDPPPSQPKGPAQQPAPLCNQGECKTIDSVIPANSAVPIIPNPQNNPDPVPWTINPVGPEPKKTE